MSWHFIILHDTVLHGTSWYFNPNGARSNWHFAIQMREQKASKMKRQPMLLSLACSTSLLPSVWKSSWFRSLIVMILWVSLHTYICIYIWCIYIYLYWMEKLGNCKWIIYTCISQPSSLIGVFRSQSSLYIHYMSLYIDFFSSHLLTSPLAGVPLRTPNTPYSIQRRWTNICDILHR